MTTTTPWREATVDELKAYYYEEFPEQWFSMIPNFMTESQPKEVGVAFREGYPVQKERAPPRDFIRRSTFDGRAAENGVNPISSWGDILDFLQNPAGRDPIASTQQLVEPELADAPSIPEAAYVSADFRDRNWLLLIDIDAKDLALERATKQMPHSDNATPEQIREQTGILSSDPAGYPYEFQDIDRAIEQAFDVEEVFNKILGTDKTQVVYSGQGAHVYLYDPDSEYRYDERARKVIVHELTEERGFNIDEQVTKDESRVIRLPYSLHADVCRVVTPINDRGFDYRTRAAPQFLEAQQQDIDQG